MDTVWFYKNRDKSFFCFIIYFFVTIVGNHQLGIIVLTINLKKK